MYFYGYDYNESRGDIYNEIYTYDKTWNESSVNNRQLVTGINYNNYWINKYGADFVPYRAMGFHEIAFRKPNQRRIGGIPIGQPGSSPMEYTNGSHVRYYYLGNRYIVACGHCIRAVRLPTGKAVFFNSDGVGITYDIENFDPDVPIDDPDPDSNCGWVLRQPAILANPYAGETDCGSNKEFGDAVLFKITRDAELDGIPALKRGIIGSSVSGFGNKLHITGLGVMIPVYRTYRGLGGRLGGNYAEIWSGDSGSLFFENTVDGWLWSITASGGNLRGNLFDYLRENTGDDEYESFSTTTTNKKYFYESFPEEISGVTFGKGINGKNVYAELTANNPQGTTTKKSNVITMTATGDGPTWLIDDFELTDNNENIIYVPFSQKVSNADPIVQLYNADSSTYSNGSAPNSGVGIYFKIGETLILGQGGPLYVDTDYILSSFVGQTCEVVAKVINEFGFDEIGITCEIVGFNGSTGPGLTYDSNTFILDAGIDSGTAIESGFTFE